MLQFTDFIPKTTAECRSLLVTLRDNPEGATLTDRYGHAEALGASEVKELASLIEHQIGEKTPKADKPVEVRKNSKKQSTKK